MTLLRLCVLIFIAGGLGALSRFGLTEATTLLLGRSYPFGTLITNVLGAFFFGVVWEMAAVRMLLADTTRVVLCVGFMGSFTTFSSLIFDSFSLGQLSPILLAGNVTAQVLLGFAALYAGIRAAHIL